MNYYGVVLLAAGASLRMGQPKQLLSYHNKSLLQHSVQTILQSEAKPVIIVLGAHAESIKKELSDTSLTIVYNEQWPEGMASSIRCGLSALLKISPETDGVIFMVCDQPFVTASLLNQLINHRIETKKEIIACAYQNTLGVPVLFDKKFFPQLLQLQGQEGAKKMISQYADSVDSISFPEGVIDIDAPNDYEILLQNNFHSNKQ